MIEFVGDENRNRISIELEETDASPAVIKVIGIGGGGSNAVNRMIAAGLRGVDYIACNTDLQALKRTSAPIKLQIGSRLTKGLGAGADPDVGRNAALEDQERLAEAIRGADMVFLAAGLGGGTGSGAGPIIAKLAAEAGALAVAVVTKPFSFEGKKRMRQAERAARELRDHVDSPAWKPFWDAIFSLSSLCLALFFGTALGNVVRGVPLDSRGEFFEPLWTDFRLGRETGIIDWYTLLVGVAAVLALTMHGARYVALKTEGGPRQRARALSLLCWWGTALFTGLVTIASFRVQPHVPARLRDHPWGLVFPLLALGGLFASLPSARAAAREARAFLASCAYLAGMLASAAFGLYPELLPSRTDPAGSLTVHNAAASAYGLRVGLAWWIPGMTLAAIYVTYLYRQFAGKVRSD